MVWLFGGEACIYVESRIHTNLACREYESTTFCIINIVYSKINLIASEGNSIVVKLLRLSQALIIYWIV